MSDRFIALPLPTNTTVDGPQVQVLRDRTIVRYDHHADDGRVTWVDVIFLDVLHAEYRVDACCLADDIASSFVVRTWADSTRLAEMVRRWKETVGWQAWNAERGGGAPYRHFSIYFDDAGCFEAVAAECRVSSTPS